MGPRGQASPQNQTSQMGLFWQFQQRNQGFNILQHQTLLPGTSPFLEGLNPVYRAVVASCLHFKFSA